MTDEYTNSDERWEKWIMGGVDQTGSGASGTVYPGNGAQHLLPESKWGHAVSLLVTAAGLAVAQQLGTLDLSFLPAWSSAIAAAVVGTVAGLLTSWAKKNRP